MEGIIVILSFICLFTGILSFGFLLSIQPIWVIIDIAVSNKISKGAKTILLILILLGIPLCIITIFGLFFLPLVALIPFFYGCFFAASSALRKTTKIAILILICALIGISGMAFLSTRVRDNIKQFKKMKIEGNKIYLEQEATTKNIVSSVPAKESKTTQGSLEEIETTKPINYSIEPFYAIHFVSKDNESITKFTLEGAELNSAFPFERPSIYPLNHIAIDPSGPYCYGITTHRFGKIDLGNGKFEEIVIGDSSLPPLSWPAGIAFDMQRKRFFITSRGYLYAYYPETKYWEVLSEATETPIVYSPTEDLLYSLGTDGKTLKKINMKGAVVGEISLSQKVPTANTWNDTKVQLVQSSGKILILASKDNLQIYIIEPSNGEVVRYK